MISVESFKIYPPLAGSNMSLAVLTLVIGFVILKITINLLTSPIPSSVPGPLIARLTSKWILFVDLSGNRALTVHALHRKYGPVVRLAPNELSFAQKDAVKPIYGIGATVIKSPVYDNFGRRGMFQMQDPHEHRERQRRVSHIFSAGTLQQMEPLIRGVVDKTVEAMEKGAGGVADAMHWCRMMALDVAGEVLMGRSFGAFEGEETAPLYIHNLDDAFFAWALEGVAPSFYWMLQWLPMKRLQAFLGAGDYIYRYGRNAVHDYLNRHGRTSNRRTLLTKLITGNTEAKTEPLPDEEIITEVSNLTFAAVDTTGTTAAYALYRLACHPEWQDKLREEIRASRVAEDDFPIAAVQALPVLNAILTETLRLHPVAPGALPRMTAAPTQIGGLLVPAGTLLGMQAYTTQRDPSVFPDPDNYDPSRWLTPDGTIYPGNSDMQEMMIIWGGKGPRSCPGRYMATMEIKLVLARLMSRNSVSLQGEQTHDDMEMTDHFTLIPKGKRCGLVFAPV